MTEIPPGFAPRPRRSRVTTAWEPIFVRITPEAQIIGLHLAEVHCNSFGLMHGGVIAALSDSALANSVGRHYDTPILPITTNLSVDYMGAAKLGQWVDFTTFYVKARKTIAFASLFINADGEPIARANATFRISPR
jgi:acyl-coenzyme A thioesterase PaaI-like protein